MRHYCLGGCSAPSVFAQRLRPVRGVLGRYLVLCLSRFPLPAPRVPRCVWRAVPSGCRLPSLAGTPFHAVCAFRALAPVAILVVPACPLRVCALALPRRPLPPLLGCVACAPRAVPALGAGRALPRGPCPSACPAPVPCSVWRAWGGAVRSRFPPTWLGVAGVAVGRPPGGCLLLLRGASGVRRSPSPDCPSTGRAVGVRYPRVAGAGVRVWGPLSVPSGCTPCGGCAPRGGSVAFVCRGAGWGEGGGVRGTEQGTERGRATPCLCGRGGACRAGGRPASFRPSAFPGQATKRVSLVSCCPWGAWPPIPLRFVLARLLRARSVRRPGALTRARLFSAAPVGAGGSGGGAGRPPAPLLGGKGDQPPLPRGVKAGAPAACGPVGGGGGGGGRRGLPALLLSGGLRYSIPAPPASSAHSPPACVYGRGRGAAPGWGGVRGGPWTAPLGAPADLNPPSALPEWAVVTGGSFGARPPYCSGERVAPARWCGLALRPRPPREQVQPHPPPPRVAVPSGGGGVPSAPGGQRATPVAPKLGGGAGGGGSGGPPPRPPAPSGVGLPSVVPGVPPRGVLAPWGLPGGRGRRVRSGWPPTGQCGAGGGVDLPALVRAPVFPGPTSDKASPFAPSWAPPVRRRPAAARECGRLPRPWCPRTPGAGASSGGVRGRRSLGLPPSALGPEWEGGGEWGGPSGPLAPPPDSRGGGRHGGPGPWGQPSAGGPHPSPAPLYLEPDPRAGPRWGPSSPRPSSRGAGRPGAAPRVSGQRLAGCGAAGSPPRSLSPPSLPREVARAPASRRTLGGALIGGPSSPPPLSRVRRLGRHLRRRLCGGWGCSGGGLRRR